MSKTLHGVLAEYLEAQALGLVDAEVREEWAAFDVTTPDGVTIEVKTATYIQSWHQERLSPIRMRPLSI